MAAQHVTFLLQISLQVSLTSLAPAFQSPLLVSPLCPDLEMLACPRAQSLALYLHSIPQ